MAALDFPASPIEGQIYLGTNGVSYQYQGDKWSTQLRASYANTGSNPGLTPPSNPTAGTFWWDSENGQLYTYYTDDDSSQWITCSPTTIVDSTGAIVNLQNTVTGLLDGVYLVSTDHSPPSE